jgi:hypothetical protein
MLQEEMRHFAGWVTNGSAPLVQGDAGLQVTRIAELALSGGGLVLSSGSSLAVLRCPQVVAGGHHITVLLPAQTVGGARLYPGKPLAAVRVQHVRHST